MIYSLRNNGYFFINLGGMPTIYLFFENIGDFHSSWVEMEHEVREFFKQDLDFKSTFALSDGRRVYGYKALQSMEKEYWKVRKSSAQLWPSSSLKQACYNYMNHAHAITWLCMKVSYHRDSNSPHEVLLSGIGLDDEYINHLFNTDRTYLEMLQETVLEKGRKRDEVQKPDDPKFATPEDEVPDLMQFSTNFMEAFLYQPNTREEWTQPADVHRTFAEIDKS